MPRGANDSDTDACEAICIQLFRERLSEKVHAAIPEGIVGVFEFAVLQREIEKNGTTDHGPLFASAKFLTNYTTLLKNIAFCVSINLDLGRDTPLGRLS